MLIDLDKYRAHKTYTQIWYRQNAHLGLSTAISIWAPSTHCPCIAVAFFIADDIGYTPELIRIIDILIKSYNYKRILGQGENSPYLTLA